MPNLYITHHPVKGRCVHCAEDIKKGSLIEICPVITLSVEDTKLIHQTHLYDYYFGWDEDKDTSALVLGYGSLYNHSPTPNAESDRLMAAKELHIIAIQDIPAGKEITINYQGTAKNSPCEIWFEVIE
nr:hypothetical protein [uncultured bacterium]